MFKFYCFRHKFLYFIPITSTNLTYSFNYFPLRVSIRSPYFATYPLNPIITRLDTIPYPIKLYAPTITYNTTSTSPFKITYRAYKALFRLGEEV